MTDYNIAKQQIVAAIRHLAAKGLLQGTAGNFSVRVAGEPAFAITPSDRDYTTMSPDDICVLDWNTKILEGSLKPSIESGLHAAVYQIRPDVSAVIHTHQLYASTLAIIDTPIPALFDEQVRFLGRSVEIISYAPSGTSFLKNRVKSKIRSGDNAFILQNHGALVLGTTVERAMHNCELLDKCAHAYLLALCTEKNIDRIPLAIREIAFAKLRADEKRFAKQNV